MIQSFHLFFYPSALCPGTLGEKKPDPSWLAGWIRFLSFFQAGYDEGFNKRKGGMATFGCYWGAWRRELPRSSMGLAKVLTRSIIRLAATELATEWSSE